jgi:hypothetical protein
LQFWFDKFYTALEVDETETDIPVTSAVETVRTWSFNYATGEIKRVGDAEPLRLFKKFLPNPNAR